MTVRLGRMLRELLRTFSDLQSRDEMPRSLEVALFVHRHRKALREMRHPRQVPVQFNAPHGEPSDMPRSNQ